MSKPPSSQLFSPPTLACQSSCDHFFKGHYFLAHVEQDFSEKAGASLGVEKHHKIYADKKRQTAQMMIARIGSEHTRGAEILSIAVGVNHAMCQMLNAEDAEVKTMGSDRVHPYRGIANEGKTLGMKAGGIGAYQRIYRALADAAHFT